MGKEKQEQVYTHGMWPVIKRTTGYGVYYSVVRWGSPFFEHTFKSLADAISYCDNMR